MDLHPQRAPLREDLTEGAAPVLNWGDGIRRNGRSMGKAHPKGAIWRLQKAVGERPHAWGGNTDHPPIPSNGMHLCHCHGLPSESTPLSCLNRSSLERLSSPFPALFPWRKRSPGDQAVGGHCRAVIRSAKPVSQGPWPKPPAHDPGIPALLRHRRSNPCLPTTRMERSPV